MGLLSGKMVGKGLIHVDEELQGFIVAGFLARKCMAILFNAKQVI